MSESSIRADERVKALLDLERMINEQVEEEKRSHAQLNTSGVLYIIQAEIDKAYLNLNNYKRK